jgi:excisionase family DNA binding protein
MEAPVTEPRTVALVRTPAELLDAPERALDLPLHEAAAMLVRVGALEAMLRARLASPVPASPCASPAAEDRLLTTDQAAARLGVTRNWLYRHATKLPFARKLSRKALRFSEAGLNRYLAKKGV